MPCGDGDRSFAFIDEYPNLGKSEDRSGAWLGELAGVELIIPPFRLPTNPDWAEGHSYSVHNWLCTAFWPSPTPSEPDPTPELMVVNGPSLWSKYSGAQTLVTWEGGQRRVPDEPSL